MITSLTEFEITLNIKPEIQNPMKIKIGEVSRIIGLTPKTIRYYESVGLADKPERSGKGWSSKGQRIYEEKDLDKLRFIKEARQLSFSIEEIRSVLDHYENGPPCGCGARPHLKTLIEQKLEEIDKSINGLEALKVEMLELKNRTQALENKSPDQLLGECVPNIGDALLGRFDENNSK